MIWYVKVAIISLLMILLIHRIIIYMKESLTTPRIKYLVKRTDEQCKRIMEQMTPNQNHSEINTINNCCTSDNYNEIHKKKDIHLCTSTTHTTPTLSADLTGKGNSYHALEKCEGVKEYAHTTFIDSLPIINKNRQEQEQEQEQEQDFMNCIFTPFHNQDENINIDVVKYNIETDNVNVNLKPNMKDELKKYLKQQMNESI